VRKNDKEQALSPGAPGVLIPHPPVAADTARSLGALRAEAADCRACPLWRNATQTVFGEGPASGAVMLVGEQPGDEEDLAGHPFVGAAGHMLDRALAEAGIDRGQVYVTNAVKHFKFEPRGKRRIHKKPSEREIEACHPWLENELELVQPALVVALGASAAHALLGRSTPIERNRGKLLPLLGGARLLITVHPSFLLRVPDAHRAEAYRRFVEDLKLALPFMGGTTDLDRL
jgi:uracil-DNA glycosylase family protein